MQMTCMQEEMVFLLLLFFMLLTCKHIKLSMKHYYKYSSNSTVVLYMLTGYMSGLQSTLKTIIEEHGISRKEI